MASGTGRAAGQHSDRRVSFSEDPPMVVTVDSDDEAVAVAGLEGLPLEVHTVPAGEHGESLGATLAEDLAAQRALDGRLTRAEAARAALWDRLEGIETACGLRPAPVVHSARKVSFSQRATEIPPDPDPSLLAQARAQAHESTWAWLGWLAADAEWHVACVRAAR